MRIPKWPKLVFIVLPILIVVVDAVVLVGERLQPKTQKAIRLVKESNSRKENFTVQQYLYTTVYHQRDKGEAMTILGWTATSPNDPSDLLIVEFSYTDSTGSHVATWEANLKERTVTPKNEAAVDLSWH